MNWMTSKVQGGDVDILLKLGGGAKLRDYIQTVYRKVRGVDRGAVAASIPVGAGQFDWQARKLVGMGMKPSGKKMFTPTGRAFYRGLNVFPGRLIGQPAAYWDGTVQPAEIRTYKYDALFVHERLFVAREMSELPTIAPVPPDVVFNNKVNLIQLSVEFPLNGWVLARPVMFVAATCLRSTIIEDLGCHWYPKSLALLPMPAQITDDLRSSLKAATATLIEKDDNLADRWRHVEAMLAASQCQSVSQMIASGSPVMDGFSLPVHEPEDVLPDSIEISDSGLVGEGGSFQLSVPNPDLRAVLWYLIDRKRLADDAEVPVAYIASCPVPANVSDVAAAVRTALASSAQGEFDEARSTLDKIAADALGLSNEELDYIAARFRDDPFLSQIRPMWAHRGLHVQGFRDTATEEQVSS
tara:strand:- start:1515 stop:2750 length:1236 start_codon:yes stop_codon:yes gene_type:complete